MLIINETGIIPSVIVNIYFVLNIFANKDYNICVYEKDFCKAHD